MGSNSKFVMEDVIKLYASLQERRTRLAIAKLKDEEVTKHLETLRKDLQAARAKHAHLRSTADQTQQILYANHIKINIARETKRRKTEVVENLKLLSKEDYLPQQKRNLRDSQSFANSFLKDANLAPWIPEKKELLNDLDNEVTELEYLKREIQSMNNKIQEQKETIDLHERHPFKNFCISLVTAQQQLASIRRLIAQELRINNELKGQLFGKGTDELYDLTQTQMSTKSQSQPTQLRPPEELERSVLEQEPMDHQPYNQQLAIRTASSSADPRKISHYETKTTKNRHDDEEDEEDEEEDDENDADFMKMSYHDSILNNTGLKVVEDDEEMRDLEQHSNSQMENQIANDLDESENEDENKESNEKESSQRSFHLTPTERRLTQEKDVPEKSPQQPLPPRFSPAIVQGSSASQSPAKTLVAPTPPCQLAEANLFNDFSAPAEPMQQDNSPFNTQNSFFSNITKANPSGKEDENMFDFMGSIKGSQHCPDRSEDLEKSGLMSMYNMVNESETSGMHGGASGGGAFFDLFGGGDGPNDTVDGGSGGKESQESAGGMFNFNFGNASADECSGTDGGTAFSKGFLF